MFSLKFVSRADMVPLLVREAVMGDAEHVHLHAGCDQRDERAHISRILGVVWSAIEFVARID
jgi:hypothetical protein